VSSDAILVLERGAFLDMAKHEDLLKRCEIYNGLWHQQNGHIEAAASRRRHCGWSTMASKRSAVDDVRRFQSEVASIREAPEPLALRVTVHTLIAMIIVAILILVFAKVDRVVTSSAGKVVATKGRRSCRLWILDHQEHRCSGRGSRRQGQVIATLDPTLPTPMFPSFRSKSAVSMLKIERALAERKQVVPTFADDRDPAGSITSTCNGNSSSRALPNTRRNSIVSTRRSARLTRTSKIGQR